MLFPDFKFERNWKMDWPQKELMGHALVIHILYIAGLLMHISCVPFL